MKEMKSIKRCLALLLALTMVISGMTIPEKKATAAEDTTVANEATEANDASVEYVAQIGEQSYATFAEALGVANASAENVTIKLLADIELTNSIEINNTNNVDITIDGTNGNERYKLAISSATINGKGNPSIQLHQKSGNITFQNINIKHGGTEMLLRLGENTYDTGSDRVLGVNLKNVDITSTSTYAYCLMATQALGQFDIEMTDVNVDWNKSNTYSSQRAFLRCGNGTNGQTVNLTATRSTIDVSDTTQTKIMHIMAKVSGEFKLNDTDILAPVAATEMYTNLSSETAIITPDVDSRFVRVYKVATANEFATVLKVGEKANVSTEDVLIKLEADIELTSFITINNTNGKNITIDGKNENGRYTLTMNTSVQSILVSQKNGNITFQNMNIIHGGSSLLLRLGENTYAEGSDRALTVNMTNMDITSTSSYAYCLMATQALGQFDINMTNVNVDWNGAYGHDQRAFLRCGDGTHNQTVNFTATGCTIDVSDTTQTQGMYICASVSGEFKLKDTAVITPSAATAMYTNKGTATITLDADCSFTYKVATANEFATVLKVGEKANASTEDVIIKLVADIELTDFVTINNINGKNITIDGKNENGRHTLTMNTSVQSILVSQKSGNITFQNMNMIHGGSSLLLRLGDNTYNAGTERTLGVFLENVDITSTSSYTYCLMATQALGQFDINMTNVNVDWNGPTSSSEDRAFLRCGDGSHNQTVNFTATECTINIADTKDAQGINIKAKVSGEFGLNDTNIITSGANTYTNSGSVKFSVDDDCEFSTNGGVPVAEIGEQTYLTFKKALKVANASLEDVTIKLLMDIELTDVIEINNTNEKNITIDGSNGDERHTLTITTSSQSILVKQLSGNITFRHLNIVHGGDQMLLRMGEDKYDAGTERTLGVTLENMDITSTSTYKWCLVGTQALGEFTIYMTNVNVEWTGNVSESQRAFLRCGKDADRPQKVNLTATGCTIDVSTTTNTKGMHICAGVSGEFELNNTGFITPDGAATYTNNGSATVTYVYEVNTAEEFKAVVENAKTSAEHTKIKLLADIELTDAIEINNAKGKNITIDGANGDGRYTLTITTTKPEGSSNHSIRVHQNKGNITFQNMNIVHGGDQMLFRLGEDRYTEATKKTQKVNLENMDITSTSTYTWCLMATQDLGQFDINMTNVNVDWNGDDATQSSRAFLRCGKGINYAQTVNLTATGCTIDVSDTTKTQGLYICEGVSGTFTFNDTDIITPAAATAMYTNNGVVEFDVDDKCNGIPDGCRTKYEKYDNVTAFKTSEGYIAPSTIPTGYVFAGWYTDKSCTAEHVLSIDDTTTSAYAKFVPDHVIAVKAQISANLLDGVSDGEKGAIRFATTVDSLDYQAVGFEYTITRATGEQLFQGKTMNTGVVYKKLYAVGTKDGEPLSYTPEIEFCAESEYFKAITFKNISSTLFDAKITVTPFWITLDGTEVCGEPVTKTVNQGIDGTAGGSESTASVYTNRIVLLADAHYMTDNPGENDAPSAGKALGYTQVQKMSFIKEDITKFAEQKTVNGVLVLGDLASDDYGYSNRTENYVQKFKEEVMANFPGVSRALPGNHDIYSNDIWNQIFGYDRQHSVKIGGAAFIMLDTFASSPAVNGPGSQYTGVDIEWLEKELEKYPTERIFLCCHNYAEGEDPDNDAKLKELIAGNDQIVCMFKGHSHSNGTYTPDSLAGIPLIDIGGYAYNVQAESNGVVNYNKFDASWAWGYQVLEWNDKEVHLYHVKPARTYTGSNGTFNFAGAIEDDIVIKLK